MIKSILRFIAVMILVLIPYWPITENFFSPTEQVGANTLFTYFLLCAGLVAIALLLTFTLKPEQSLNGWLFFSIGMISMIPLHLGPPREGPELLTVAYIEQIRYGMLLIAVALFFLAGWKTIAPVNTPLSKIFLVLLLILIALNGWDSYSSFMFSTEMRAWVNEGKRADEFFITYDFHEGWRTLARTLLYISTGLLSLLLFKRKQVKKWQLLILNIFCIAGVIMCVLFLLKGPAFYFPFMVPAIALAPAYWLGLMLILKK